MTVRRLTQWTKQFFVRLAARVRLTSHAPNEKQPVLVGSATARATDSSEYTGPVSATHWLDDARRMRPRRIRSVPLPQPKSEEPQPDTAPRPQLDPHLRRAPSSVNSLPLSSDGAVRSTPRDTATHKPEVSPDLLPEPEPSSSETGVLDETLRRRLRSLQFLVRHGVYNEGFARNTLPEQYRQSAGQDDFEDLPL